MLETAVIRLGLVGDPVSHSRSPALHSAALAASGLAGEYRLYRTPADSLLDTLSALRASDLRGLNVTVPHKTAVLPFVDRLDPGAARIGAVNTLVFDADEVVGHNTDQAGFLDSLAGAGIRLAGETVLVVGTGGASKAVLTALVEAGADVQVVGRRPDAALALAKAAGVSGGGLADARPARIVVNASSVGMGALPDSAEWAASVEFFRSLPVQHAAFVFDLVYATDSRAGTPLLAVARENGIARIDGLDMLVRQAGASFELWTGVARGRVVDAMRASLRSAQDAESP